MTRDSFDSLVTLKFPNIEHLDVTRWDGDSVTEYYRYYTGDSYIEFNPTYGPYEGDSEGHLIYGNLRSLGITMWAYGSEQINSGLVISPLLMDDSYIEDLINNKTEDIYDILNN